LCYDGGACATGESDYLEWRYDDDNLTYMEINCDGHQDNTCTSCVTGYDDEGRDLTEESEECHDYDGCIVNLDVKYYECTTDEYKYYKYYGDDKSYYEYWDYTNDDYDSIWYKEYYYYDEGTTYECRSYNPYWGWCEWCYDDGACEDGETGYREWWFEDESTYIKLTCERDTCYYCVYPNYDTDTSYRECDEYDYDYHSRVD